MRPTQDRAFQYINKLVNAQQEKNSRSRRYLNAMKQDCSFSAVDFVLKQKNKS